MLVLSYSLFSTFIHPEHSILSGIYPTTIIISSIPASFIIFICLSIKVFPRKFNVHLGFSFVRLPMRVPFPAARIMAFILRSSNTSYLLMISVLYHLPGYPDFSFLDATEYQQQDISYDTKLQ